jgi:large subunit ribosomal protein L31
VPNVKSETHPDYYPDAKVICACGEVHHVGSTKKEIKVEVCSKCHPFFTGQRRIVDTAGRVDRFIKKYNWGSKPADEKDKAAKPAGPKFKKGTEEVQEILQEMEAGEAKDSR